jgi:hypothetical protein
MNQTVREKVRCGAIKASGAQCRNNTVKYADFCWVHTKLQKNLQVRISNIPGAGQGLFAVNDLPQGTMIRYARDPVDARTKAQLDSEYGDDRADYGLCNARNECFDAASTQSGLARWINSSVNSGRAPNVELIMRKYRGQWKVYAKTTRNIRAGSELYARYGTAYFGK